MDTKKIEGWVDPGNTELGTFQFAREDCRLNTDIPATLVLGKAFSEEEVKSLLSEIIEAREAVRNSPEGMVWATVIQDIRTLAAKHGIKL